VVSNILMNHDPESRSEKVPADAAAGNFIFDDASSLEKADDTLALALFLYSS
jgi:hypothetical protein